MILGRPTNLWLGFVTTAVGLAAIIAVTVFDANGDAVATVSGGVGALLGALIILIAGQPPTVTTGDTIKVITPAGQANETRIVG